MMIKNSIGIKTKIFAKTFEQEAIDQVKRLANFEPYLYSKIRIMPDGHAGKGCTIGTTMTLTDKVTPNLVGVDIGCGMHVARIREREVDLQKLDSIIREYIPSGFSIHKAPVVPFNFSELKCAKHVDLERASLSIGSLGGGNHFIELGVSESVDLYLVIHTGSRSLGVSVCKYYQELAWKNLEKDGDRRNELISELKKQGREKDIEMELKGLKKPVVDKELAFLEGDDFENYIHDMKIVQGFASVNRMTISDIILDVMNLSLLEDFETPHNYIDTDSMILRKGAISARKNERVIIPMNMRDGSLICIGKGNEDWNYSAPHGAGRIMSRSKAKEKISIQDYEESMKGIFSTSVNSSTVDEAPQAYKPMDEIVSIISETVDVVDRIVPIYNFKAG